MDQVVKATALKPWRGLRARDLRCSDEAVETRAIETMRKTAVNMSTEWVTNGTLLKNEISRVINCVEMMVNGLCRSDSLISSSVSCGASGRGGVLGIGLITATYGKVYNGITDDDSCEQPESDPTVCLKY